MNDAEIRAKVDVGDGGGFLRLGNSIKQVDKQAMFLKTRIDEIKRTLARADMGFEVGDTMKLEAQLEKAQNQYNSLYKTNEKVTSSVSKGWEKGTKNLGRFLFNMFAVGSVFALVAKASRNYLETNDEAQAQTEITANTMGQLLAPAMKVILDMTQYLVIGFALLIKMFTGYDALAKVTTKNIKKTSDATKDLNKQLTSMDEITNLSDPMGGAGITGLQADLNALDAFNEKIEKVQALFEQWNVQGFVNKLKDLWHWIVENKEMVITLGIQFGIIFGAAKMFSWLSNISRLIGVAGAGTAVGTGLAGLLGVLLAIAAIEKIVTTVVTVYKEIKNAVGATETAKSVSKSTAASLGETTNKMISSGSAAQKQSYINLLQSHLESAVRELEVAKTNYNQVKKDPVTFLFTKKSLQNLIDTWQIQVDTNRKNIKLAGGVPKYANGGVLTKATLGIAGEYSGATTNPEIISPQSLMKETMIDAFSQIIPMMNKSNGDVTLNVNGREFAKATFSDYEYEGNRLGKTQTTIRRVV